jgi:MFS family permease
MKRTLIFLVFGPTTLVIVTTCLVFCVAAVGCSRCFASAGLVLMFILVRGIALAFLLGLALSAVAGLIDGFLAQAVPLRLRASLIAIFGAAIAVALVCGQVGTLPQLILVPLAISGAFCMGACSLLSNDYRPA